MGNQYYSKPPLKFNAVRTCKINAAINVSCSIYFISLLARLMGQYLLLCSLSSVGVVRRRRV